MTYKNTLAILLSCLIFTTAAFADVKIKTRQTAGGQQNEYATFIKGKRERTEQKMGDAETVNITQCDLRRNLQILPQTKTYTVDVWQQAETKAEDAAPGKPGEVTKGGVVTSTITTKDTGERKQMFGYAAKHLIITMETKSSPDACTQNNSRMVFDGWYIDAAFVFDCINDRYKNYNPLEGKSGGCRDRYETKQVGTAKRGYAVYEKMTMFDEGGKEISSSLTEVLEISNQTLDAALFDAPAGYREVKDSAALYASMAGAGDDNGGADDAGQYSHSRSSNAGASSGGDSDLASSVKNTAAKSIDNSNAQTVGAKKAGVVRVGLAAVKTGAVGEGMNAAELAGAVQNTLSEYLKSPNVEVVALEAKLPGAIDAEAKSKECDYVIYAQVSHKKGGGGMFGKLAGNIVGAAINQAGYSGNAGAVVSHTAANIAYTAAASAENVKAKDEITLDVKLSKGGTQALAKQFKAKAKGDGDDIITQVVEQAAQAVLDAAK